MIEVTKNKSSAVLIALCGALLFSSKAVLIKFAYQYDVDKLSLLVLRMGFALPFYLFFAFKSTANKKATPIKKKDWISYILIDQEQPIIIHLHLLVPKKVMNL